MYYFKRVNESNNIIGVASKSSNRPDNGYISATEDEYISYIEMLKSGPVPDVEKWVAIRNTRDYMIKSTDYFAMPDYPITSEQRNELTIYRQALRDLPQTYASPDDVVWPTAPDFIGDLNGTN